MNQSRLAIVIPAYKPDFLDETLASLASQVNKGFTVYIGDDCSPYHLYDIVCKYESLIQIVYHRFDTNLGGKDLVAQWERCIAMSKDEEYIWLFSDDDVMEPNCVAEFYKSIEQTKNSYNLYHFDINIINEDGEQVSVCPAFPEIKNDWDYYEIIMNPQYSTYVVEYIFSRKVYEQNGGFVNFDLAWGSDKATWTVFCGDDGLYTIPSAKVNWRRSSKNITPDMTKPILERKMMANCEFLCWAYKRFYNVHPMIFDLNRKQLIRRMGMTKRFIGKECFDNIIDNFFSVHGHEEFRKQTLLRIFLSHYKNAFFSSKIGLSIKRLIR